MSEPKPEVLQPFSSPPMLIQKKNVFESRIPIVLKNYNDSFVNENTTKIAMHSMKGRIICMQPMPLIK